MGWPRNWLLVALSCCGTAAAGAPGENSGEAGELICDVYQDYEISFGLTDQTAAIRAAIADCRRRAVAIGLGTRAVVLFPNHNHCATKPGPNATCDGQEDIVGDPDGTILPYVTGAINATSNMTLRIERGAMILGVPSATLFHYPLVVQYAPYGDGTTPGCELCRSALHVAPPECHAAISPSTRPR
jgi:polygalacturonase